MKRGTRTTRKRLAVLSLALLAGLAMSLESGAVVPALMRPAVLAFLAVTTIGVVRERLWGWWLAMGVGVALVSPVWLEVVTL